MNVNKRLKINVTCAAAMMEGRAPLLECLSAAGSGKKCKCSLDSIDVSNVSVLLDALYSVYYNV